MNKKLKIILSSLLLLSGIYVIEKLNYFEYGLVIMLTGAILVGGLINNGKGQKL